MTPDALPRFHADFSHIDRRDIPASKGCRQKPFSMNRLLAHANMISGAAREIHEAVLWVYQYDSTDRNRCRSLCWRAARVKRTGSCDPAGVCLGLSIELFELSRVSRGNLPQADFWTMKDNLICRVCHVICRQSNGCSPEARRFFRTALRNFRLSVGKPSNTNFSAQLSRSRLFLLVRDCSRRARPRKSLSNWNPPCL